MNQLHVHNMTISIYKSPEGKWKTLENSSLRKYQKAISSKFRASLSSKLKHHGFQIENKFDVFLILN